MKNNMIAKIINDLEKTNHYVEFKDSGKIYQLFGCDIEKLNNCMNAIYCQGLIMVSNSLKNKEKIQAVKKIITEISISHKDRICIDLEGGIYCENK